MQTTRLAHCATEPLREELAARNYGGALTRLNSYSSRHPFEFVPQILYLALTEYFCTSNGVRASTHKSSVGHNEFECRVA